jgi:hypothetical protein
MVGQGEPPTDKTTEEIACVPRLAQDAARNIHNSGQDD